MTLKKSKSTAHKSKILSNTEIMTLAVYLLGGDGKEVDTEDVAIKVNELMPGRFTWRKYPEQINIEIIRAFLSDAKKEKYGAYLSGTGTTGWLLTDAGLKFSKANVKRIRAPSRPVKRLSNDEKRRRKIEQARIVSSEAFNKYASGDVNSITRREVDVIFRLNDYIIGETRHKKVQKIINTLGEDKEIGDAVRLFAKIALEDIAG